MLTGSIAIMYTDVPAPAPAEAPLPALRLPPVPERNETPPAMKAWGSQLVLNGIW